MPTGRLTVTGEIGGVGISATFARTADGQVGHVVSLPQAKAGSITTYSAGPPQEWTLSVTAHGLSLNDNVDIYVASAVAYGMKVTAVVDSNTFKVQAATAVPSGSSAMPTTGLPVSCTVSRQTEIDTDFDTDLVQAVGLLCTTRGHGTFAENTGSTLIKAVALTASELWSWFAGGTEPNPLGANKLVGRLLASQGDSTRTGEFRLGLLYDSTI